MAHTPGPWTAQKGMFVHSGNLNDETAKLVASTHDREVGKEEAIANASLIAAAPDLLEACKLILPIIKSMPKPKLGDWNWPELARGIRLAVEKADGR